MKIRRVSVWKPLLSETEVSGYKYPTLDFPAVAVTSGDGLAFASRLEEAFGRNANNPLPGSPEGGWGACRAYSFDLRVLEELDVPDRPPTDEFIWKVPFKNEKFTKRRAAGEIVVSPYSVGKLTYTYTASTVAGVNLEVPGSQTLRFGNYSVAKTRQLETNVRPFFPLPAMYFHPQGSNASMASYTVKYKKYHGWIGDHPLNVGFHPPVKQFSDFGTAIDCGLVTKAYASSLSGTYDALTELAEMPETLRWLLDLCRSAADATVKSRNREVEIQKLLKRKVLTAVQAADAVADVWLQYRYAIKPLAYSIEDIGRTLLEYQRIYAKFREKTESVVPDEVLQVDGWVLQRSDLAITARCAIKNRYTGEGVVNSLLDLIKINPFSTAWELVPLSFVIDWFVNIGDVITSLTGIDYSIESKATYSFKVSGSCYWQHPDSGATVTLTADAYERIVINPKTHVDFVFEPDLNLVRKFDALALMWGPISQKLKGTDVVKKPYKRRLR